jgi:hypothetical protein
MTATLVELMQPFAQSIWAKCELLRGNGLDASKTSVLRDAIKWDIKIASNLRAPSQSQAARQVAEGRAVDLSALTWGYQPSVDPGRETFALEHFRPVSQLRDRCLALSSAEQVLDVLVNELEVVWVLRTEDNKLNELGYRSNRPSPELAYKDAGIVVIREPRAGR